MEQPNMEQRPAIFKLNLDCFDRVFDYLSLKELSQFAQTCKAMKAAVGEYYQENYGTTVKYAKIESENLCLYLDSDTIGYSDFIQKLEIVYPDDDLVDIKTLKLDLSRKVIELQISVDISSLTEPLLHRLQYVLSNVETVVFWGGGYDVTESISKTISSVCKSLKRLHMHEAIGYQGAPIEDSNQWIFHEYPTLEHLEWTQEQYDNKIHEINTFFVRNPNVRSFTTNIELLWTSRHFITKSGIRLDDLTIVNYNFSAQKIQDFCTLLNKLYENGVYKRLHLKFPGGYDQLDEQPIQHIIDQIIPVNVVRSMCLSKYPNINLSRLVNLVELRFTCTNHDVMLDVDMMASYLVNLERVHFDRASLEQMLSFIYHCVKLNKLKVTDFDDRDVSVLNLANMNQRREQLFDARKVTIFIEERIYLATKWASKITDFRLIEMQRNTAHEWGYHFFDQDIEKASHPYA